MLLQEKIVRIRKIHNLNQEEFAEKFCVSRQAVSKWENGNAVPDVKVLSQIADMAGITLDELVREEYDYPLMRAADTETDTAKSVDASTEKEVSVPKDKSVLKKYLHKYRLGDAAEVEKVVARAPWVSLGWSFLHWLLVVVLGAVSAAVWYSFMIDTGESYAGSLFVSEIYMINPVTYPLGCILFLVGYYVIWKRYLKPDWKGFSDCFWLWRAGYVVISLITVVALFFVFLMVMFLYCGLTISVHPRWTEDVIFVFPAYAVLMPIVDLCVGRYQRLKG